MMQVAACECCGRMTLLSLLGQVEVYAFEHRGGAGPAYSVLEGVRMFCPTCRVRAQGESVGDPGKIRV